MNKVDHCESNQGKMDICNTNEPLIKKYISIVVKNHILQQQNYKCANTIKNYKCLLWTTNNGFFDEAGYEFDHIDEFCLTSNNTLNNIQALCPNCHSVKTKRFMNNKKKFTTSELDNGANVMDIDL
jgi:5-methylcytosine-specific restriction endonuclease McrA